MLPDLDLASGSFMISGLRVIGGRRSGRLTGGTAHAETHGATAYLYVVRADSPQIVSPRIRQPARDPIPTSGLLSA